MSEYSLMGHYGGERAAGLVLTAMGIASALAAAYLWRNRGAFAAAAWPLALCSLVELGIGLAMALKAQLAIGRGLPTTAEALTRLATELHGHRRRTARPQGSLTHREYLARPGRNRRPGGPLAVNRFREENRR